MSKTPHAATRAPQQAEGPKATLPQLGELVAQMNKGLVGRDYMQDFLRRRLVRPGPVQAVLPPEPATNALLTKVEEIAREHYPHAVNEILEVVAPFCDPNLDLEFKPYTNGDHERVMKSLFWLRPHEIQAIQVVSLRREYDKPAKPLPPMKGDHFGNHVGERMFAEVFRTYNLLNTVSDEGAKGIVYGEHGLYCHLHKRFEATGVARYNLLGDSEAGRDIMGGIAVALTKAILFAVTGDKARLAQAVNFLDFQRSGHPVYHWHENVVFVFALCEEYRR